MLRYRCVTASLTALAQVRLGMPACNAGVGYAPCLSASEVKLSA